MKLKVYISFTYYKDVLGNNQQHIITKDDILYYFNSVNSNFLKKEIIYNLCNLDDEKLYNLIKNVKDNSQFMFYRYDLPIAISEEELFYEVLQNDNIKQFLIGD